jgi:hypothetical protein
MDRSVGHVITPDQLMLGVRVHMVLVADVLDVIATVGIPASDRT